MPRRPGGRFEARSLVAAAIGLLALLLSLYLHYAAAAGGHVDP